MNHSQMGVSLNPADWFTDQATLDIENGDKVLSAYFSAATIYPGNFSYASYDDFRNSIGGDTFVGALGANVRTNMHPGLFDIVYFPYDDAAKRVQALAASSQGQASPAMINQAAIDLSVDALTAVTSNIQSGIVGTSNLIKYLPWILVAGVAAYIYVETAGARAIAKRL